MPRLLRFLATLVVLLGLLPCELREALPGVGELVAGCCADDVEAGEVEAGEVEAGEHDDDGGDCCDSAACLFAARATVPIPGAEAPFTDGHLLLDETVRIERPTWRAGPPPTPPPMA